MKELDLSGRVAVVIGGTSGIGLALTQGLADGGADVVPISRRKDMVDRAAGAVEARGRKSLRLTADALDRAALPSEYQKLRIAQLQHQLVFDALSQRESARVEMLMREHAWVGFRYGQLFDPSPAAAPALS